MLSIIGPKSFAFICGVHLGATKSLWSTVPATYGDDDEYILKTAYLLGNGKLGAIPFGPPGEETIVLNLDSLWSGGPFENLSYTGGNPPGPVYQYLPDIRNWIFQNGTGNVSQLLDPIYNYGSYQTLGNLSISFDGVDHYTNYQRRLDLDTGIHTSSWISNGSSFQASMFCSYPAHSCVYNIESTRQLLPVTISLVNKLMDANLTTVDCGDGYTRLTGTTQASIGLQFDSIARISGNCTTQCLDAGSLIIHPAPGDKAVTVVWSAESDYDQAKGNPANKFSFRGEEPGPVVEGITASAASQRYDSLLKEHLEDYTALMGLFSLDLPDTANSSGIETSSLIARYTNDTSDPFLESLLFDYSRHLLISSSREGSLPANLQGRWTEQVYPAWSADYHANINLQMNYWGADQTGLGALSRPVFEYMTNTWAPRGSGTAQLLYNGSGWVTHDEMNIFGYTGMKNDAQWANYPASAAWMMLHVFDHYDYNRNITWLTATGYPLLKAVASFWISQLQEDLFFNDGTLVVNPCNSPEQGPTTFGCTHYQQLIHQVLEAALATAPLVPEEDTEFLNHVSDSLSRLDTGIHINTSTGVLKEWKVPDSYLYNIYPQHRHLSHLVGWFPGYSISSFADGYTSAAIQDAVRASLIARGDGTSADGNGGNYGWPKVWRGACWARLNDSARAYEELRLSVANNIAPNLLSMYGGKGPPFQIDMNFGWAGNVLSLLVVDMPLPGGGGGGSDGGERTVVLGPAIPSAWGGGSVNGLRVRGGVVVDFEWDETGLVVNMTVVSGDTTGVKFVNVRGERL
ncbi:Alpha-fucosidase A [Cytospora mali]|uniref:Alpha-fucosidase A n=1 Tax=Cytospora mali TaxID=578113 RepID=A0A194W7P0_CYTMA|nr:Alpha-fucosidase A [Valsa mali]